MGLASLLHQTPGMVSTSILLLFCAEWNALMLLKATSKAAWVSLSSSGSGNSCSKASCQFTIEREYKPCYMVARCFSFQIDDKLTRLISMLEER